MKTKAKIKVPTIWYNENVEAFKFQTKNEPKHLLQLQNRYDAMYNGKPSEHDIKSKTNLKQLSKWLTEAENDLGTGVKRLAAFIAKYEPSEKVKPDYLGALAYLKRNAKRINNAPTIKSKWDYYAQMVKIEQTFYLPVMGRNFDKVLAVFEAAEIRSY